ncbi:MAG TPA: lytic transglycosylase domain-containing protein [Stellaceae bacterium]|jgi:hypothetical protein
MRSLLLSATAALALCQAAAAGERNTLDRVAFAVDGAESSHGQDNGMWRPDPDGPQGPMQVSAAAAADVGGGDRFDTQQNRALGRAYLEQLFARYHNWPDAIAAYNWGIGNMKAWVAAGRPPGKLADGVEAYIGRVLHDSGLCTDNAGPRIAHTPPKHKNAAADALAAAECAQFAGWRSAGGGAAPSRFYRRLDQAMQLAAKRLPAAER